MRKIIIPGVSAHPKSSSSSSCWSFLNKSLPPRSTPNSLPKFYETLRALIVGKRDPVSEAEENTITAEILDAIIHHFIKNAIRYHRSLWRAQEQLGEHFDACYCMETQLEMHESRTKKELEALSSSFLCLLFLHLPPLVDYQMALDSIVASDMEEKIQSRLIGALPSSQVDDLFRKSVNPEKKKSMDHFIQSKLLTEGKKSSAFAFFSFFSRLFETRIVPKLRAVRGFFARANRSRPSPLPDQKPIVSFSGLSTDCLTKLSLYDIFYRGIVTALQERAKTEAEAMDLRVQLGDRRFAELMAQGSSASVNSASYSPGESAICPANEFDSSPSADSNPSTPSKETIAPATETPARIKALKKALLYTAAKQMQRFYGRVERGREKHKEPLFSRTL